MSWKHLGETFDIHGGGIDLVFPHHENEIAQSRCAFHTGVMANFWMHNGFLQVEGEKMAKSAGNFVTIRELLADWPGDVIRVAMLGTHYRQPINWTLKNLEEAERTLGVWFDSAESGNAPPAASVVEALTDDLNTPKAIAEMHALRNDHRSLGGTLQFLGLRREELAAWRKSKAPKLAISESEIERLVSSRLQARKARNFAESDRIRDELAAMGVVLKDSKDGTTWEIAR
jgi:cysteinyl-tRNA synthetase